jgi:hypothetical protein
MNAREYQMNGFTFQVRWTHVGQYRPYGDTFRVAEVITDASVEDVLELMKVFFNYNVPLKENWNPNDMGDYFAGYCTVEPITGGYKYTKCEPYTD